MAALTSNAATLRKVIPFVPDINLPDHNGNTALHHAANDEWVAWGKVKELVHMGPNIEARNNNGQTALHIAADTQRSETADELVECGASVNAVDKIGRTPLIILIDSYAAYFDSMIGKYEIGEPCYFELPALFEVLINQKPGISHRDSSGASALNFALFWYLLWVKKDAFEEPPPQQSLKTKFEAWEKRRIQEHLVTLTSHSAPRAKIPSAVHDFWVNIVLACLHNAELNRLNPRPSGCC
ncbi:ankyrin repeat domain-containing protein [Aspergillus foveolatus]|uniref:ankyrin repeat domain-containing protein n=1 Tax=Aspergillus foveolatus TaxID=210207 RepID=UPI003CCCE93A